VSSRESQSWVIQNGPYDPSGTKSEHTAQELPPGEERATLPPRDRLCQDVEERQSGQTGCSPGNAVKKEEADQY
jgi:hypothetical protein